jgi:hypothetical protein
MYIFEEHVDNIIIFLGCSMAGWTQRCFHLQCLQVDVCVVKEMLRKRTPAFIQPDECGRSRMHVPGLLHSPLFDNMIEQ